MLSAALRIKRKYWLLDPTAKTVPKINPANQMVMKYVYGLAICNFHLGLMVVIDAILASFEVSRVSKYSVTVVAVKCAQQHLIGNNA